MEWAVNRSYEDTCGIARALDAVGERWAILVVRELLLGPKRFTDLRVGLPRIGPDMLAARLQELEHRGLIAQRRLPPPAARTVYELTDRGAELGPVLHALGRWGSGQALGSEPPPLSPDAAVIAMQTLFEPDPGAHSGVVALRLGEREFELRPQPDWLGAAAAAAPGAAAADATIETEPATLAAILWHGLSVDRAVADGRLRIGGDERLARSLLTRYG
jgi:DNA-binding HxlR family transcriptional regulator